MTTRTSTQSRPSNRNSMKTVRSIGALAGAAFMLGGCVVEAPTSASVGAAPGYGYTCYAGAYVCRVPVQTPIGAECSCPGIGAPSFGRVR
ncbi:hypothetical protein HN018_10545 [Lichenicola cladoniae]|uniref:Uncharacterized protein n=1 Tax=Lichenicola cladoniae TaxID=1484109 RepID=A0A6M8HPM6_9PROT|nr:hypothetical protein [Lichenicola cladoniae]NPD69711.1 hypothetical protein [Acetobacteraceae bacterium]QKE90413.1 hypothetical protein HN018_10545 [Lichenicola cladoniae]